MTVGSGKLSPWAILACVLSIGLCPFVTAAAIPAGLWALRDVRVNGRRGRRLALAAIVIGVVVTPLTTLAAWWWDDHVRVPLLAGPAAVLQIGQQGEIQRFIGETGGVGEPQGARAFLVSLTSELGMIRSTRPSEAEMATEPPGAAGWWGIWVPYEAMFDQGAATVTARFLLSAPDRGWVTAFDRFEVTLPSGQVLTYPADGQDPIP
ncbi:MAG: hypothetical protein QF561_03940 [Phycisphaerales bacterium]|jgi:hypothetical protein|nr:hypothetical protein [Phycisphaerales bacterium]